MFLPPRRRVRLTHGGQTHRSAANIPLKNRAKSPRLVIRDAAICTAADSAGRKYKEGPPGRPLGAMENRIAEAIPPPAIAPAARLLPRQPLLRPPLSRAPRG